MYLDTGLRFTRSNLYDPHDVHKKQDCFAEFTRLWLDPQTSTHSTTLHPSYPTLRNEPLIFAPHYNKFERGCNLDDPKSLRILPSTMSCLPGFLRSESDNLLPPIYHLLSPNSSIKISTTYCFVRILYTVEVPQALARVLEVAFTEVTAQSPEYGITYYGDRLVCINFSLPALLPGKCLCY